MKKLLLLLFIAGVSYSQTFAKMPMVTNCGVAGDRITDDTAAIQACTGYAWRQVF